MAKDTNIYAYSRNRVLETFCEHVSGSDQCLFLALGTSHLSSDAALAITKTAESLGYGPDGATFLQIDEPRILSDRELFEAVEGMDPLCIVVADEPSKQLFAQAYRLVLPKHPAIRVFGREVRVLPTMNQLLETPAGKQTAWASLKTLPRMGK